MGLGPKQLHKRKCPRCKAPIVWARTVASVNGPGGKPMPLDFEPNPAGNVAASVGPGQTIRARVLTKDEDHDHRAEWRAMPHFPTCTQVQGQKLADDVEDYLREQASHGATS